MGSLSAKGTVTPRLRTASHLWPYDAARSGGDKAVVQIALRKSKGDAGHCSSGHKVNEGQNPRLWDK